MRERLSAQALLALGRLAILGIAVFIWQVVWWNDNTLRPYISTPRAVASAIGNQLADHGFHRDFKSTLVAMLLGFALGVAVGTIAGLILGTFRTLDRLLDPWLAMVNALPRIALAPIFIIFFGVTTSAKVYLAASIVVFVQIISTRAGVRSVDADLLTIARLSGMSRIAIWRKVVLPSSVPHIFASLRLCSIYALLGVIASELIASTAGLGQRIVLYTSSFNMANAYAVLVIIAAFAGLINTILALAERRFLRWQE